MEFLADYAGFLARTVTIVAAILVVVTMIASLRQRERRSMGQLDVERLNDFYADLRDSLRAEVLDKAELKRLHKQEDKAERQQRKAGVERPRVYVLDFDGDLQASATENLRQEITAVLSMARAEDEVVVRLESGGGMVHGYGLAASQLARIRQAGVPLTVCVDKVAASGGYMMACIADRILAAPFAILGSIGVVAQLPNFHRLLQKHDIDYEVLTAGEYKRTLTLFGENTDKGREKFQEDLETTHQLFKEFVSSYRPQLDIDQIATGEVWLGQRARSMQLVDELQTSDEYLASRAGQADLFLLHYHQHRSLQERIGLATGTAIDRVALRWWERLSRPKFL